MADYVRQIEPEQITSVNLSEIELSDKTTYFLFPMPLYGDLMAMLSCSKHEDAVNNAKVYTFRKIEANIPHNVYQKLQPLEYRFPNGHATKKPSLLVSQFKIEDLEKIIADIVSPNKNMR